MIMDRAKMWRDAVAARHPEQIAWADFRGECICPVGIAYDLAVRDIPSVGTYTEVVARWLGSPPVYVYAIALPFEFTGMRGGQAIDIGFLDTKISADTRKAVALEIIDEFIKFNGCKVPWWEVYDRLRLGEKIITRPIPHGMEISPG